MSPESPPAQPPRNTFLTLETSVSKAILNQALGIAFDHSYYLDPFLRREMDARCHEYVETNLGELDAFYTESNLGRKQYFDARQILVGGIQPNLILGMLLGAEFIPAAGGDADISPACWADKPLTDLPSPERLLEHPLIQKFDEQIRCVQQGGRLQVVPPFFWDASGRAALHGALTTAQKFLGEQILLDMLSEPRRAREIMDWIVEANIVLVRHFATLAEIRITDVHVGECSSCMVGAAEWEGFVRPGLERLARELGTVRLHSCGPSDHLVPRFKKVEGLSSLDLGGETSLARVRELFGTGFRVSIAPPVKLLTAGSLEDLWGWTERVLTENRGGQLVILYHLEPQYPLEVLRQWRRRLVRITDVAC
jgi:hypothetical protein